jgi:hypothetical protein
MECAVHVCYVDIELVRHLLGRLSSPLDEPLDSPDSHAPPLNMRLVVYVSHDPNR